MTREELQDAMRKLREFAVAQGMQWVLDEVDEAIELGIPEIRTLRLTNYEDVHTPDKSEVPGQRQSRRRGRSAEFARSRPMPPLEQAQLLVQALGRVLADLDAVAVEALEALDPATLSDYADADFGEALPTPPAPHVGTISFLPDEGSAATAVSIDVIRSSQRRTQAAGLLSEIEAEIGS